MRRRFSRSPPGVAKHKALDIDGGDPTPQPWREPDDAHGALRSLPAEITGQARQLRRFGSLDQVERAAALLEDVKRELYAILANGRTRDEHGEEIGA